MAARHLTDPALSKQATTREQRRIAIVEHWFDTFMNGGDVADAAYRAHDQRHPLMRRSRSQFQNAPPSSGRSASRPLHHQRHGMGFVQQAKPSLAISGTGVGRIKKHAAAYQDAKGFGDQRTNPPHVEIRLAATVGAGETFVDVGANGAVRMPAYRVRPSRPA